MRDEFAAGAAWLDEVESGGTTLRRRRFIELMASSFGLAGLTSCSRRSRETIVPYVKQPEDMVAGEPRYYATALSFRGHARGVLVESHEGRPTKIEGNPDHPSSLGATDAAAQAAVLDLYDPDRSRTVKFNGSISTWNAFESALKDARQAEGKGFAILIEPSSSPTLQRLLLKMSRQFPRVDIYQHSGLPPLAPEARVDLSVPDLIVAIDDDFLGDHPASLRHVREFSARRRSGAQLNRLYVIEPTPTLTGSIADHRLAVRPSRIRILCEAIAGEEVKLSQSEALFVASLREDLKTFAGRVLIRSRIHVPALNALSITRNSVPATLTDYPGLEVLAGKLEAGSVSAILILGGNPVYSAPGDSTFAAAISKAGFSAHLGTHEDETSAHCQWHLPEAHALETWGDLRDFDGTPTVQQPLIEPLYEGRSAIAILGGTPTSLEWVRQTWREFSSVDDFEAFWKKTLHDGFAPAGSLEMVKDLPLLTQAKNPSEAVAGEIELVIRPDANLGTGAQANNGWLQELPRPFSKLVWDNAALIAPSLAARLGLRDGDIVELIAGHEAPVWILPGQAGDTVTVHLGYGRSAAGAIGNGVGFNAFPLIGKFGDVIMRPTGRKHELITTQHHSVMEGRELIWQLPAKDLAAGTFPDRPPPVPKVSLFPPVGDLLNGRYAWAMSIDLSTCIGCNACVLACQAENNIPVVGKSEVARGREMHWIRLDRYFVGENAEEPRIVHQPVTCQHCEQAPCEVVCPVEATVHTADGLNAMVYNRCVGTRYCSNNCPYKVRRFNFFDYRIKGGKSDPRTLQANPEVTVRARGVMEKCTYCVQRIQRAVIRADRENRRVRDGEILTACQQACPAESIVFGDLRLPDSRVSILRNDLTAYSLLGELNTRPRTHFLARLTNPHV